MCAGDVGPKGTDTAAADDDSTPNLRHWEEFAKPVYRDIRNQELDRKVPSE
jgi:hypothetical protein